MVDRWTTQRSSSSRGLTVGMRSGHVAAAAGVNVETLRYYERRGRLDAPDRTPGGHRLYAPSAVAELRFIKAAQRLGFSLHEIADLLRVYARRGDIRDDGRDAELRACAAEKLTEVEGRIADLLAIRDTLRCGIDGGCEDPMAYLASPAFQLINEVACRGGSLMALIPAPVADAAVTAIHAGELATLRRLLAEHPALATARPDGARTLLHVLTDWPGRFPNGAGVVRALVEAGADVNARFQGGEHTETPLHWAASCDDVEVLDALLDAGADIDAAGAVIAGGTPLTDARAFKQWNAARRLVERGAHVTLADAATLGLMDRVTEHFTEAGPPPQAEIDGGLWNACHGGQREPAEFLLGRGADVNWIPPWQHLTALDATGSDAHDLARWLVQTHDAKSATELTA